MTKFRTKQEKFWAGNFGNDYNTRNKSQQLVAGNAAIFSEILSHAHGVRSLLEYGAGTGNNILALQILLPRAHFAAVEINSEAVEDLKKIEKVKVYGASILDFKPVRQYDFVLVKGFLIHMNPDTLKNIYNLLYKSSKKYICIMEYYSPTPTKVTYRGHKGYLFKRDFAGEIMDMHRSLKLVSYGFRYHRDSNFPLDDISWFLLKKA